MRIIRFVFSLRFALIIISLFVILLLSTRLMSFTVSQDQMVEMFDPVSHEPIHHYYEYENDHLHYISCGDSTLTPLLLVHGSPGTWDSYAKFISETDLLKHFYVIAVDRPGYGESGMADLRDLKSQSSLMEPLINRYFNTQKGVILGHSYGGAVCLQLAVDYPTNIQSMVLAAGTLADIYQEPRWYNYIVKYTPVGWLVDESFKMSNQEMWLLSNDLRLLYPELREVSIKTAIIQGGKDFLVNPQSPDHVLPILSKSNVKVFYKSDMDHFIIWNDQEIIINALAWTQTPNI